MLRASAQGSKGPVVICGITDGNIERLKNGMPILADLNSFGVNLPGQLTILYGPTEADLELTLAAGGRIGPDTVRTADPRVDQEAAIRADHARILICTVGLPRAGKTTWAKSQAYPVVNPDSIRLALHGQRFAANAEPFVWATAKVMVRALFLAGHRHVILDATNVSRKRRDEWRSKEWGTFFKVFTTPAGTCKERAADDSEILPVIDRMAGEWEHLGDDELRWPGKGA